MSRHRSGRWVARTVELLVARDGPWCGRCPYSVDLALGGLHPDGPTVGHLIPVSAGGSDALDNLHLEHRRCNLAASDRDDPPAAVATPGEPAAAVVPVS